MESNNGMLQGPVCSVADNEKPAANETWPGDPLISPTTNPLPFGKAVASVLVLMWPPTITSCEFVGDGEMHSTAPVKPKGFGDLEVRTLNETSPPDPWLA
ncbi:MAG TPA: hypothetical protein VKR30_02600 [Candidatus Limnocylindrales bacterium]|nr:hypothetical protein [Candidatus Limnocylindrales bacterium]